MTHFTQTKQFAKLQASIAKRNATMEQARQQHFANDIANTRSLNEVKASLMAIIEDFDSRSPRLNRTYTGASDIASL